jgi:RNA polymerase sigma-70 factor (ECF subfamily)
MAERTDITQVLKRASAGDSSAVNRLLPLIYDELRGLAESYLQREPQALTLQATALVHEAYIRLIRQEEVEWRDRAHFFAAAAQAIRHVLVDYIRTRRRQKRGGGLQRVRLDDELAVSADRDLDLLALDEVLNQLAQLHPRQAQIVELRFFGGLSPEEIARFLEVSPRTVFGDWRMARTWLWRQLHGEATP